MQSRPRTPKSSDKITPENSTITAPKPSWFSRLFSCCNPSKPKGILDDAILDDGYKPLPGSPRKNP